MNQNIKNTLYRFKTMRAPELIGDEDKENHFVTQPTGVNSKFEGLILGSQEFSDKANTHQLQDSTLKSLKTSFGTFYKYAIWLTKNRTSLTKDSVVAEFNSVRKYQEGVDTAILEGLWNDLHYLASKNENAYLRDAIISILVADFFYKKVLKDSNTLTDEEVMRIAQARVVLDLNMSEATSSETQKQEETNYRNGLEKAKQFISSKQDIRFYNNTLGELTELEKSHQRKTAIDKVAYDEEFNALVEQAYDKAVKVERVVTDKETGETSVVTEYEGLVLPEYDFKPAPELEINPENKPAFLSELTLQLIESLKKDYSYTSFQEVKDNINKQLKGAEQKNLKYAPKLEKQLVYKGIPLSNRFSGTKPTTFELCFSQLGDSKCFVVFRMGKPDASYVVSSMVYTLRYQDGNGNTNGSYNIWSHPGDNVLSGELYTSDGGMNFGLGPVDFFEGTINFTNGESFSFRYDFPGGKVVEACGQVDITWASEANDETNGDTSDPKPSFEKPIIYGLQRLGIADYRKVEQEVCCYVPGEVSHIENIMAREYKEKSSRRLRRQEDTTTTSSETEREQLSDTTSTDRFEMNQEISTLEAQDQAIAVNAGATYGNQNKGFSAFANASFANNTSTEESNIQAVTHAQELTERALDRVVQKVKEERIVKIIDEYEENNSHGFDNRKGDTHISGVYRWVDKIYKNQIHNYGKRLMYEFMVPEPSSFHNKAVEIAAGNGDAEELVPPVDPRSAVAPSVFRIENPSDIVSESIAKYWAGIYNVEISSMPEDNITTGNSESSATSSNDISRLNADGIVEIPEGYEAIETLFSFSAIEVGDYDDRTVASVAVGDIIKQAHYTRGHVHLHNESPVSPLDTDTNTSPVAYTPFKKAYSGSVPYSASVVNAFVSNFNISVFCRLTEEAKGQWRQQAFNAIIEAYEEAKAAYDEKMANIEEDIKKQLEINPGFYRKVENDVLRKNCIAYLIGHSNQGQDMLTGSGVTSITPIQNQSLTDYAEVVKFFEQAFEWDIMSYYFYPFYWAKKSTWALKFQVQNDDPLFRAFLQSGMARVIVTVRPGFEEAVNWYLATGQIWNGGQVPTPNDEEFISIVEELDEPESIVEETWETRVPTSLTVIQAGSIGLNVEGLPCDSGCETSGLFDSDQNPIAQTNELIGGSQATGTAKISGRVTGTEGVVTKVVLKTIEGVTQNLTYTDAESGTWDLTDIPAGRYELLLDADDDLPGTQFTVMSGQKDQVVELQDGETIEVNLDIKRV